MHFERLVSFLKKSKKLVLFLVEGISDETTFGLVLSNLVHEDLIVRFHIIGGDLTTRHENNASNCIAKVVNEVKDFLNKDFYRKSDLFEVIHLVDLDGTFISKEHVVFEENVIPAGSHIFYTNDYIITDHIENIQKRNEKKSKILEKLSKTKEVFGNIPYHVYYFSCNLEHVIYNLQNANDVAKYPMAKEMAQQFIEEPMRFVQFMNSDEIVLKNSYQSSWDEIKKEEKSLKRYSNFNLYLNQFQNN